MDLLKKPEDKPKKATLERKPSIKAKMPPPVRQTLTSYKRMLKANPLMQYQEAGIDVDELIAQKSLGTSLKSGSHMTDSKISTTLDSKPKPTTSQFKKPEAKPLMRTQSLKLPKSNGIKIVVTKPAIISRNQPHIHNNLKKSSINNGFTSNGTKSRPEITSKYLPNNKMENKRPTEVKSKVNSFPKGPPKPKQTDNSGAKPRTHANLLCKKETTSMRRSLSSGHLQVKKGHYFDPRQSITKLNESQSEENICIPVSSGFREFSPIMEDNRENRNFVFKSPSAYDRRSICHYTPRSNRRTTLFQASTPAPVEMQKLQERLNKWLKSRGKPPASFHHLRVFGSNENKKSLPVAIDENKENIDVLKVTSESYENLSITTTPEKKVADNVAEEHVKHEMNEEDIAKNAKEAMSELQKLIDEDYPREQCLGWLELIREKYKKIDDEPEYWECRAAIEQSVGNVHNAVEFYKTAIIQGAEVNSVDKSLDQLLKKFSLLNISPKKCEQKSHGHGDKERIIREARNVFKSSIIQFAIRERNMKKKDDTSTSTNPTSKKLVAIPVRRSTRLSRSGYTNTSGVQLCTSLRLIDLPSEEISFEKNKGFC